MKKILYINPKKNIKVFLVTIGILLLGNFMYLFTIAVKGYKFRHIFDIFYFNSEGNLPTLYSVIAILCAAALLFLVGFITKETKRHIFKYWIILGSIFVLLAYDEAAQIHERLAFLRTYVPEENLNIFYWAWVIPYGLLTIFSGLFFLGFLKKLPLRTSMLFISAGAVYVTGALIFEMLPGYFDIQNPVSMFFFLTTEELLEMIGIVIFIYAILDHIKNNIGEEFTLISKSAYANSREKNIKVNSGKEIIIED